MRPAHAIGKLIRRVAHACANRLFDRIYGVSTHSPAPLAQLTLVKDGAKQDLADRRYEGVPVLTFISLMRTLPGRRNDLVFIDYGSGKGRAVLLAARFGFKRIVGVEFATELHQIATHNVEVFRRKKSGRRREIQLVLEDAAAFDLPNDPCVFFLYNPFPEHILSQVLTRIEESYARAPRDLFLVYLNPRFLGAFQGVTCLRLVARRSFVGLEAALYSTPYTFRG